VTIQREEAVEQRLRELFDAVAADTDAKLRPVAFLRHDSSEIPAIAFRTKSRSWWAFAAALLVLVLSAGVAAFRWVDRGGDASNTPGAQTRGTTRVRTPSGDLTLSLPAGWQKTPLPVGTTPKGLLTVGTSPKPPPVCGADSAPQKGTWLSIYDVTNYVNKHALANLGSSSPNPDATNDGPPLLSPPQQQMAAYARDRPADFLQPMFLNVDLTCGTTAEAFDRYFREGGRIFDARILATHMPGRSSVDTDQEAIKSGLTMLNSLHVRATKLSTTTTP
jgi:hypothetical protein